MKNPILILLVLIAVAVAAYFIGRSTAFKNLLNKPKQPKEGDTCTTADGKSGTVQGGICTPPKPVDPVSEERMIGYSYVARVGNRIVKCYPKPANSSCANTIYDPRMGMGRLYSQTPTSCCYLF